MMAWKADHVQGVLFPLPGAKQQSSLELWRAISPEAEPEAYQGAGPSPVSATQASGKIGNFQLSLTTQIGRIDLLLTPDPPVHDPEMPPQIEDLEQAFENLVWVCDLVIRTCKVARVATVVQLSVHFTEPSAATSFLTEKTKIDFPTGSTDNIYQTNVRRKYYAHETAMMNRVCTFNTGVKQLINAQIDFSQNNLGFSSTIIIPVAALKLDINSATNNDITPEAIDMIREHIKEINLIVANGMESLHA